MDIVVIVFVVLGCLALVCLGLLAWALHQEFSRRTRRMPEALAYAESPGRKHTATGTYASERSPLGTKRIPKGTDPQIVRRRGGGESRWMGEPWGDEPVPEDGDLTLKTDGGTVLRDKDGNMTIMGLAYIDGLDGEFDCKITPEDWFKF